MRKSLKPFVAVAMGAALVTGLAACDSLPPIEIPTQIPDVSIPPLPTGEPAPQPIVTETVTADPAPQPIVTETVTSDPAPQPIVTETVTAQPGEPVPQPTVTVTVTADPAPQPTATVTATVTVTPGPEPVPSPSVTPTASAIPEPEQPVDEVEDPTRWWPWILLGLVIAGVLAWWGLTAASRSAGKRRLGAARAEMAWAEESLTPHVLAQPTTAQAAAAWEAGRAPLDDLDREFYDQSTQAPTQALRTAAVQGRAVLAEFVAALDAETSPDAGTDADAVRASRARVDAARAQVRAWMAAGPR